MLNRSILILWMLCHAASSIYIPSDVEILEGYNLDESAEYYPSDGAFYEAKSLASGSKLVRNRRSPLYDALSPPELPSNPKSVQILNTDEHGKGSGGNRATVRSSDVQLIDRDDNIQSTKDNSQNLPRPEKQIMPNGDYFRKTIWNDQSDYRNDFSTYHKQSSDDDDSLGESTNEGIKARTPRVNFITQPKKTGEEIIDRSLFSKLPTPKSRFEKFETGNYELYPSRSYDPYLRRYDRYDDAYNRYNPYNSEDYYLHRRHYDPYDSYSPRMPSYPEQFYDYPDRRFDVPEPREYRSVYNNEIFDRPSIPEPRNRRIIYYAHLPEIVRTPTSSPPDYNYSGSSYRYNDRSHYDYPTFPPSSILSAYRAPETLNARKDAFGYMKREKKNNRNFPSYQTNPTTKP